MEKKLLRTIILLLSLVILLTSCSKNGTEEGYKNSSVGIKPRDNGYVFDNHSVNKFTTEEEYFDFIRDNENWQILLKERAKKKGLKENEVEIIVPENIPEGFEIAEIVEREGRIRYDYVIDEPILAVNEDVKIDTRTGDEVGTAEEIESEMQEKGLEEYYKEHGIDVATNEELKYWASSYWFVWTYVHDEYEEFPPRIIEQFELNKTSMPGYYGKLIYHGGMEAPVVYSVYWIEDGYMFQVDIPCAYTDPTSTENIEITDSSSGMTFKIPKKILEAKPKILNLDE
jgi:hypothetical protein